MEYNTFFYDRQRKNGIGNKLDKKIWYVVVLIGTTVYVFVNFSELIAFTFFDEFNGKNLIFILWIILILIPMIDSFEGFGVRINTHQIKESEAVGKIADDVIKGSQKTADELESEIKKLSQNTKNDE